MDINKCAEEILNKNIRKYQDIFYVPKIWMKHIINKNICKKSCSVVVFGYRSDVDRFMECMPKGYNTVICKYTQPEDWVNLPGKEFHNEELVLEIAKLHTDKLVIVSDSLRYLLQMYLIGEKVSYEIVDIYELIKKDYRKVVVKSIANPLKEALKEYVKWKGRTWLSDPNKSCDNYDAILVKKYYAKKAKGKKEKAYYLQELIINYLLIKDFKNAFTYIDYYVRLFGTKGNNFVEIKQEFLNLFSQMKKQLHARQKKDIVVFWCDALPYTDFKDFHFLEKIESDSLIFENAYTHVPYTHTTSQTMFTGIPFFEGELYRTIETGDMIKHGKTLDLLVKNSYQICEVGGNYINKKYVKLSHYKIRSMYPPATMNLWETLAQLLQKEYKKKFIVCHMDCELHNPYWNGDSEKLCVDPGSFLADISKFETQRKESARYLEKEILYYLDFFGENTCKIFMSDHGIGGPAYLDRRLHAFCFVKDPDITKGRYKEYFSYLKFYDLLGYILQPTEDNFKKLFSEYVLIQNDHPYSKKYCEEIMRRLEHNEDIQWKNWMGFRGIIKNGYKLIRFPNSHEIWFNPQDEEISLRGGGIMSEDLIQFMRTWVGDEFPDIYTCKHYENTKKLYDRLQLDFRK